MFLVAANTRQAIVGQKEWITTRSSGIQVQFLFSSDWDGLSKFAVFRNAEIEESVIPIALPASGLTELPAENCDAEYVDEKVYVGVYGTDGLGHIIIPTIWVSLGVLKEGAAYEGMDPPQPTPDMWAQILAIAQNAGAENAAAAEQSAGEAEASKEAIQDMNVQAETLPDESPLTVTKEVDSETGAVTLIFGLTRGPKGNKGDDGYSPTIMITPIQGGHRFTVTDKEHPSGQSFDVMNGAKGDKGYSPAITITTITGGHRFTVTDEDHPTGQSFDVMDGAKGDAGYSPAVTITTITGGHRVTITDEDHPTGQSFDVMDGASDAGQVSYDQTQTYQSGTVGKELSDQKNTISQKQTAPSSAGTAGQVLGLDSNLDPVWVNQSGGGGDVSNCAPIIINTASGDIASFADGADNRQIRKIVGTIVPQQAGSGDPSPTNKRSISGYTQANLTGAAKNLFHISIARVKEANPNGWDGNTKTMGNVTYECSVDANGIVTQIKATSSSEGSSNKILYLPVDSFPAGRFALNGLPDNIVTDDGYIGYNLHGIDAYYNPGQTQVVFNVTFPLKANRRLWITVREGKSKTLVFEPQIRLAADTDGTFETYKGATLPISWQSEAGTVYGGTLTLNEDGSADLVATHAKWIEDGSRRPEYPNWKTGNTGISACLFGSIPNPQANHNVVGDNGFICDSRKFGSENTTFLVTNWGFAAYTATNFSFAYSIPDTCTTKEEVAQYFSENPVEVVYPLLTPQTYHFDNVGQLYTYLGTNNVWIDTGAITECDYPADTKLYIDGLTEPDEDMIANANIASGKYFVVNNQLYLSTAAIAAGASIIPGTNCTATNLAEALNALNT